MTVDSVPMKYNPDIHHRRSVRLKGYNYSRAGLYFITICTQNRLCLFGDIQNGEMTLNEGGKAAEACMLAIPDHYTHVRLHQSVVMPNHIHCIIEITPGAPTTTSQSIRGTSKTVGSIVRGFKIGVTKWFRENTDIHTVWQRNYHDHIIRDEKSYDQISEYTLNNPLKWRDDRYYEHVQLKI